MPYSRIISWVAWIIASIFYAYQYVLRVMPNIMFGDVMSRFQMDTKTFGQFSGMYYIGYCAAHIPIGIMLDRYGPKKVMPICILISVIGLLPIIYTDFWLFPIIGRVLVGIGSSAAILSVFKVIRITFNEARFTRMLSISVTIGLIGAIYGGAPVSYMNATFGYEAVIETFAVAGLILAAISYLIIPNAKESEHVSSSVFTDIKDVFCNVKVILICLFAGLMVGPIEGFADVWGTAFFEKAYGMERGVAASLPSMMFIGMCFGAPALSIISEKTRSQFGTIFYSGIVMTLVFAALIQFIFVPAEITIMFVIVGICSSYQIIAIYKASTYVREGIVGLTTAVANMIIMIFGYFFHGSIGLIIDATGGIDSPSAFKTGISVVPSALLLGTIGFAVIALMDRRRVVPIVSKEINADRSEQ